MLDVERKYYAQNVTKWLKEFPGKVVVVKGEVLLGAFDSVDQALTAGASKLGLESFLVRTVGHTEKTVTIPALTLGILNANTTRPDSGPEPSR